MRAAWCWRAAKNASRCRGRATPTRHGGKNSTLSGGSKAGGHTPHGRFGRNRDYRDTSRAVGVRRIRRCHGARCSAGPVLNGRRHPAANFSPAARTSCCSTQTARPVRRRSILTFRQRRHSPGLEAGAGQRRRQSPAVAGREAAAGKGIPGSVNLLVHQFGTAAIEKVRSPPTLTARAFRNSESTLAIPLPRYWVAAWETWMRSSWTAWTTRRLRNRGRTLNNFAW